MKRNNEHHIIYTATPDKQSGVAVIVSSFF